MAEYSISIVDSIGMAEDTARPTPTPQEEKTSALIREMDKRARALMFKAAETEGNSDNA